MSLKLIIAVTVMLLLSLVTKAQQQLPSRPQLSDKHQQKLEKITDPEKKLRKYKKYFKQDSINWAKKYKREFGNDADSLIKEQAQQIADDKKQELNKLLPENIMKPDIQNLQIDSAAVLNKVAGEYQQEVSTITSADSITVNDAIEQYKNKLSDEFIQGIPLDTTAIRRIKETPDSVWIQKLGKTFADSLAPEELKKYQPDLHEAKQLKDSASFDYVATQAEKRIEDKAKDLEEISAFQEGQKEFEEAGDIKPSFDKEADLKARKTELKKQMVSVANEQLKKHMGKVEAAQAQLGALKKKYSKVVNSNDLSTAVKRSSLEGKTFWQRLVLGGNFQVQSFQPITLDASPTIGYRINKLFNIGVGGHWRHTFGDTIVLAIPTSSMGYKAFISHQLYRNFFGYSEYERQQLSHSNPLTDDQELQWKDAWHIGLGRNIKVNRMLTVQVLVIYNLLHDPFDPLYSSPWNVKAGVQMNTESIKIKNKK